MTHEQKCEELLDGSEFSPRDKERIYCVNIGVDQCSILSSNNTTTSPPSSPSLDAPQPNIPTFCSVLSASEFELEYDRQHALETVTCIENYFKHIKSHYFDEKKRRIEEAILSVELGKDCHVQKRVFSSQLCIGSHVRATDCRKNVAHHSLSIISDALRMTLLNQKESDIERTHAAKIKSVHKLPSKTVKCEPHLLKSPTFRKPRKRHQPLSSSVPDSKRVNLSADDKGLSSHSHSFQSPIANQLRQETTKNRLYSVAAEISNSFPSELPCMVYRLRDLDIDSDINVLCRWKSTVLVPSSTPYGEGKFKKSGQSVLSCPVSTPVLLKSCSTNRNLSNSVSKRSPPFSSKHLTSDGISKSPDVPCANYDQSDQKLSFTTKQLLKQKLSPRCLAVPSLTSLPAGSPLSIQPSRHNTSLSRALVDTENVPSVPLISAVETLGSHTRFLSQYTHPQTPDSFTIQKPHSITTRIFTQQHRPQFSSDVQSPNRSCNEGSFWTLSNTFSPARDASTNLSSPPSWSQQCETLSQTQLSLMKDFRISEGSQL